MAFCIYFYFQKNYCQQLILINIFFYLNLFLFYAFCIMTNRLLVSKAEGIDTLILDGSISPYIMLSVTGNGIGDLSSNLG